MRKTHFFAIFALFTVSGVLFGAEITVPRLEVASRGAVEDGNFGISSSAAADIALDGGYKYGIKLGLGAEIQNLEKALSYGRLEVPYTSSSGPDDEDFNALVDEVNGRFNNQATLSIRSVVATVRDVFGKPLEIDFFIGHYDSLGSGDVFQDYFGTVPVGTDMRGFFYYPEGLGGDPTLRFNGAIHSILGTGLALKAPMEKIMPSFYIYHDLSYKEQVTGAYKPGHYSADFRLLANSENSKIEGFLGITYVNEESPVVRGGVLTYFSSGPAGILIQAGLPYYKAGEEITIDNWYFLMEPRFHFSKAGIYLTFFYKPVYYMNREIEKAGQGKTDINLKLFFGDINRGTTFEGGIEGTLGMSIHTGKEFDLWISPFLRAASAGLLWDVKIRFNPSYFNNGGNLAEGYVGIRTAY